MPGPGSHRLFAEPAMSEAHSNHLADEHLLKWQATGDIDSLDLVLRTEIETLKARLRFRGGAALDGSFAASDLAQEAVLGLLRVAEAPTFQSPGALRAYLWTAAWRLLQARLGARVRAPKRRSVEELGSGVAPAAPSPPGFEAQEQELALHVAMNLLREEERELLGLIYFDELDIAAAAEKLGLSRDAANMRLVRARRNLAHKLKDWRGRIGEIS